MRRETTGIYWNLGLGKSREKKMRIAFEPDKREGENLRSACVMRDYSGYVCRRKRLEGHVSLLVEALEKENPSYIRDEGLNIGQLASNFKWRVVNYVR